MTVGFPSGQNTFVPTFEASGKLITNFSRNHADFPLNKYVTITPVKKNSGYYLQLTADNAARVLNTNLSNFIWPAGNDAPTGEWQRESFQFQQFNTIRYAYPFLLDYLMEEQADWDIKAQHAANAAQQAMTARTVAALTVITNTANYASSHTSTATSLGGGLWTAGTSTNPYIMNGLQQAMMQIQVDTNAVVSPKDMVLVISPKLAVGMAKSAEMHDFVKGSPYALAGQRWDSKEQSGGDRGWGIPTELYGVKVVIEDAVYVTSQKGQTRSADYILGNATAALLARPGALIGTPSGQSFSSVHIFMKEEMTVETKNNTDQRRMDGRVVEDFGVYMVANASAYLITTCQ